MKKLKLQISIFSYACYFFHQWVYISTMEGGAMIRGLFVLCMAWWVAEAQGKHN